MPDLDRDCLLAHKSADVFLAALFGSKTEGCEPILALVDVIGQSW